MRVSIQLSQISVAVVSEKEIYPDEYETLRNFTYDLVSVTLDVLGYWLGCGYDCDITSLINSDNSHHVVFGVGLTVLEDKDNRPKDYNGIIKLFNKGTEFEQQLKIALFNFKLAIRTAADTPFYCYRAIEALQGAFSGWDEFNSNLKNDNSWILEMKKKHADIQRHGKSTSIFAEERQEILKNTQLIIDKFIQHLDIKK